MRLQSIISKQLRACRFRGVLLMKDQEKMSRVIKGTSISRYPTVFLQFVRVFLLQELREKIQRLQCYQDPPFKNFALERFQFSKGKSVNRISSGIKHRLVLREQRGKYRTKLKKSDEYL